MADIIRYSDQTFESIKHVAEYYSKEAVVEFIRSYRHSTDVAFRMEDHLYEIPAADVLERKNGKWIVDRKYGNDIMSGEQMVICSECHKGVFSGKTNFCPNCGADMRGEQDE